VPAERNVDLAAQVADVQLHHVDVAVVVRVPHRGEQVGLGHRLPGVAHQVLQHRELAGRQGDLHLAPVHPVPCRVQHKVADGQRRRPLRCAAAQQRPQPGQQHHQGERLGEVVVGTEVERVGLVVLAVLRGEHEHRRPHLRGAQPLQHPVPRQPRQHDVEHDDVEAALGRPPQAVLAVVRHHHHMALRGQPAADLLGERHLVLHEQHPHVDQPATTPPAGLHKPDAQAANNRSGTHSTTGAVRDGPMSREFNAMVVVAAAPRPPC